MSEWVRERDRRGEGESDSIYRVKELYSQRKSVVVAAGREYC